MRILFTVIALLVSPATTVFGKPDAEILFSISTDLKGEVAVFSEKGFYKQDIKDKPEDLFRYDKPLSFVADNIKIWTFEGDGDKVTIYTVGIAGRFKTPPVGPYILLRRGDIANLGDVGKNGDGPEAFKGVDELLLEPGQSYVLFRVRDRDEAIALVQHLGKLLK
jgi:hypothetical protein